MLHRLTILLVAALLLAPPVDPTAEAAQATAAEAAATADDHDQDDGNDTRDRSSGLIDPGILSLEFGLGAGAVMADGDPDVRTAARVATVFGFGVWITPRYNVSLLLDASVGRQQNGLDLEDVEATWGGGVFRFWPTRRWTLGFGFGSAVVDGDQRSLERGHAFRWEGSYVIARSEYHSHHLRATWLEGRVGRDDDAMRTFVISWVWQRL